MKNNEPGISLSLRSVSRFFLKHFTLAILAAMILSGCGSGGGGSGGGGSGGESGTSADTSIVVSPSSALLTSSGQTQQLSAVVYKADGTVDSAAQVTWKVADPTAASVSASGNTATVTAVANPGFTQVVATSGALTANASIAIATPATHTHVLDHSLILSASSVSTTSAQLTLQSTPETTAIQVGDYIVSQGVLAKVAAIQIGNNQLTLSVTPASLSDAFTSFKFSAQGVVPQGQLATQNYTATLSPRGVLVQPGTPQSVLIPQGETIPWSQVQCTQNGSATNFQFTEGSVAFDGLIPTPTFSVTKDPTTGVEAFTAEVSAQPTVTIKSPSLTFNPSLTGSLDCKISLQKVQLPTASFYGIVSLDFDVTPVIGFTASATLSSAGSASFTGPQLQASTQYDAGFNWSSGVAPSAFHTVGSPTVTFKPFSVTADTSPSLNLDFEPYAAADIGMDVGVHVLFINFDATGIDFSEPKIGLDTSLGLSSLPSAFSQDPSAYQGPTWSANLDANADFSLQTTGLLQEALQTIGFNDTISLGTITLLNIPVSGSPTFTLATTSATAISGGTPVVLSVAQAADTGLIPENDARDTVQFWEMSSGGSPSLLDTTTLSSGGMASYSWMSTGPQAGNDTITALIFGLLGGIDLPYASTPVDVTVSAISAANSIISATPSSIPADGATASAVTVQLYDTSGQKITVGGATVQIASTLGTVSSVTDNGNGTYTAQLTSTVAGTAVLSFTVNGVASTDTANVSVTPLASNITVSTTTPASGATGVSIGSAVSVTFNGAIDASTLNASTFTLTGPGGAVAGTVTYNASTDTATFTPSTALAYSTTYTATITTGVTDTSGNPLASNYSWSFTTAGTVTAGEWTWEGGSSTGNAPGVYGTLGQAAPTNVPGARYAAVTWTDAAGNLWLFGGYNSDPTGTIGNLNDLWKYTPATGEWTWEGGSSTVNAPGVYGTLGQAAPTNVPGARWVAVSWTDAAGTLWLFGGVGYDSTGTGGVLNDLWQYQP